MNSPVGIDIMAKFGNDFTLFMFIRQYQKFGGNFGILE